jgi:hypothetical protein
MGGNRVSGRVVTFSSPRDPDRVKDFFDAASDFWLSGTGERRPILYRHGADRDVKRRRFGEVQLTKAADGLWATGYIAGRDEHSEKILAMAQKGLLNWSTGSVQHLVEKSRVGSAWHVDSWPISECSLCPTDTVAEPRNIVSLKALVMESEIPDFDSLVIPTVLNARAEQKAYQIYVEFLQSQHERRMRELMRNQ